MGKKSPNNTFLKIVAEVFLIIGSVAIANSISSFRFNGLSIGDWQQFIIGIICIGLTIMMKLEIENSSNIR